MPRALIVSAGNNANEYLARHMADLGYTRPAMAASGGEARRQMDAKDFEVIVINTPLPDEFGHELGTDAVTKTDAGVILLTKTALGRSIYCVGGNPEAARLSGINSANVLTFCYTLSGFMAALADIVSIGRSGICNGVNAIQPYDTDAIAACIIGGASFMGGKGTMVGTMLGALIIAVLRNGFSLLSVSSAVQNLVLGLVIIGAVLLDVTRERMEAKARRLATK